MGEIRLSICIPTYNFGEFIGEALQSIIGQGSDEVEIIVGDGGSTDNTAEVVKRFQSHFPGLAYHNFGKKSGVDLDLSKTVELARGNYCWLMSSDDALKPGAIQRVLGEIKLGHEVYLVNRTMCDRHLRPIRGKKFWLSSSTIDRVYHLSDKCELLAYLNAAESIGALFSYVSSIVVQRNKWNEVGYDGRFTGSNFAHVFRLFSILKEWGSSLKYIRESCILCRGGNDSFLDKGIASRFRIDFDGYWLLAETLFLDAEIREAFKAVMRREHRWYTLPKLKSEIDDDRAWKTQEDTLLRYGYSSGELSLINIVGSSRLLVRLLRSVKKSLPV
jgi:abequosyltransferase